MVPRRSFAGQFAHVGDSRVLAGAVPARKHAGDVGLGIGVVLVPFHARRHRQELLDRHAIVGASFELGDVAGHRVVDGFDIAVLDRRADQAGGQRFRDREARPALLRTEVAAVPLKAELAILQDQQARFIHRVHQGVHLMLTAEGRDQRAARWKRVRMRARRDPDRRKDAIHPPEVAVALLWRPEQHLSRELLKMRRLLGRETDPLLGNGSARQQRRKEH